MFTLDEARYLWGWISIAVVWFVIDVATGASERRWIKSLRSKEKE